MRLQSLNIPIHNGYIKKIWYPFVHDPKKAYQAHFHKILATATAVKIAKKTYPNIKMEAMVHMTPVYPSSHSLEIKKQPIIRIYLKSVSI